MTRTAEEIRKELGAPDFTSIMVWRLTPGDDVISPTHHTTYRARFGDHETIVSSFEYDSLLHAGATDVKSAPTH